MDQSFIRLAQYVSAMSVEQRHIQTPIFSVALDAEFSSLQVMNTPERKFRKRIETIACARGKAVVVIPDNVFSKPMQSAGAPIIALAFDVYGIKEPYLHDMTAKGYIDEVVERRHAVAHGRESPVAVGVRRVAELRLRYDALYKQAIYVIDTLSGFCNSKKFVLPRHRRSYP